MVPVPRLALSECNCFMGKVDALFALCDQMEASLNTRSRLLEVPLHEALCGEHDDQAEAAA